MSKSQIQAGSVTVDGVTYDWRLHCEPHLSDDEGWKGMTIALVEQGAKREAQMEFPAPNDHTIPAGHEFALFKFSRRILMKMCSP